MIFFREALALDFEKDDVIVRRRLIEKFKFMLEGMANMSAPTETQLTDFYAQHAELFIQSQRYSFSHYYFSADERVNAQADAQASLQSHLSSHSSAKSAPSNNQKIGDPFMMRYHYSNLDKTQISNNFGKDFSKNLASQNTGSWIGPIESIYGWHLVKISNKRERYLPKFTDIKDKVAIEFQKSQRVTANKKMYDALLAKYEVSIADAGHSK